MKHHHDYPAPDPDLIVGQILAVLSDVPLDAREGIMAEVQHRVVAEPEALPDPDLAALHEWGMLSTQSYTTLTRRLLSDGGMAPDRPIRLGDVARLSSTEISTISNLGRQSYTEILHLLDSYGFRPQGSDIAASLSAADRLATREKMARRMAEQAAARLRDHALLKAWAELGANWRALAARIGCSERALRGKVAAAARRIAFREANPLPPPGSDRHRDI